MSTITPLSDHNKPPHQRNDSDELDVFEAARYFSDYNDKNAIMDGNEKVVIKEERKGYLRQGRASLDMPSLKHQQQQQHYYKQNYTLAQIEQHPQNQQQQQQQQIKEKKKYKQPSSPGGKLAHFLNSLFNQKLANSKNKKQPSKTTQSIIMKDENENPNGRRQRRSSISHFPTTGRSVGGVDAKSLYSSSSSGFRTPPPYNINTPTKTCQNVKSFSDYKQVLDTLSKIHENVHPTLKDDNVLIRATNVNGIVEKPTNYDNNNQVTKIETNKFDDEVDEGAESDASSDLFELQLDHQFGFCSSGLPVYETTHMDHFKRPSSTAITNGPIKK